MIYMYYTYENVILFFNNMIYVSGRNQRYKIGGYRNGGGGYTTTLFAGM